MAAFIELLIGERVEVLVDVRLRATSGIPGFSGPALLRALGKVGIEYRHASVLGNPEHNRAAFRDGPLELGRRAFSRFIAHGPPRVMVEDLAVMAETRRVAVLCAERDHARCHRQVIIERAEEINPRVAVTVLA